MTETARMYGGSLYDLAAEEGLEARILGELDEACGALKANPDYLHLLSTPASRKERCGLLDEALRDQVHLYVLNFLKILCEKGHPAGAARLRTGLPCALQSGARHSGSNGDHCSGNDGQRQPGACTKAGKSLTGKTIDLKTKVDPAVLGGIRLDIEGTELDGTVQNRLAALRRDRSSFRDTVIEFPPERFLKN